jgi:F420-dependent oxidoreductase-like protein
MQVCLMIEGQEGVTWAQWLALARACEEFGFEGLFRSDHYLGFSRPAEGGALDAWSTIAALGPVTERIRLGTMVSPVTFRHPAVLARSVVTADHASGGRVELGMGAGWFEEEHRAHGFPFPAAAERMAMLAEQIEIVHRLWGADGDEVSFEGAYYRLQACPAVPAPVQSPHPPLIVGGHAGPKAAAIAARWADEYDLVGGAPDEVRAGVGRIADACAAIGRDAASIRRSVMLQTVVGADEGEVRDRAVAAMAVFGEEGDPDAYLDDLRSSALAGTPEQVLERLALYADAGIDRVLVQHLDHADLEAVTLLGREVVPAAAAL